MHPNRQELSAFALGRLGEEAAGAVASHVAGCARCQSAVAAVPADPLLALVRKVVSASSADTTVRSPTALSYPAGLVLPDALQHHPRYEILERLGAGGMGVVYRARHRLMDRTVALKVIARELTNNPAAIQRFQREVQIAAQLSHPQIVQAYDAERAGSLWFLVMEFIDGTNLGRLVEAEGPLPVGRACSYVFQAAQALEYAFGRGLVHRDIKPPNLLLTLQGQIKVCDFGLAGFLVERRIDDPLTRLDEPLGTPDYVAPEQAVNAQCADIRADIYSLGCTLYYLLTGRPPGSDGASFSRSMQLQSLRPDVPEGLELVLSRMLDPDKARRYQHPAELLAALRPFAGAEAGPSSRRLLPTWLGWSVPASVGVLALGLVLYGRLSSSPVPPADLPPGDMGLPVIDSPASPTPTTGASGTVQIEAQPAPPDAVDLSSRPGKTIRRRQVSASDGKEFVQ